MPETELNTIRFISFTPHDPVDGHYYDSHLRDKEMEAPEDK